MMVRRSAAGKRTGFLKTLCAVSFLFILLAECSFVDDYEYRIDPILEPYVNRFFQEAEDRGIRLSKINLVAVIEPEIPCIDDGHCDAVSFRKNQRTILIAQRTIEEAKKSPGGTSVIEFVVFHELSHALLYKNHINGIHIMDCCGRALNLYVRDPQVRRKLLDDLFR
jgi:hypothetical protein